MTPLLCTDLDRTLIPNGPPPESPSARPALARLHQARVIQLAYVSGRHLSLIEEAILEWQLPRPDFIIADVGSSLYRPTEPGPGSEWEPDSAWQREIAPDWGGYTAETLHDLLRDLSVLKLQEPEKQGRFKLSYYCPEDIALAPLLHEIQCRLGPRDLRVNLIHSHDEPRRLGLLDILPERANKRHAIEFLRRQLGLPDAAVVFAGDSGNDLAVLAGGIPSVLVANANPAVREEAQRLAAAARHEEQLYLAHGDLFAGLDGRYAAGILEGLAHFRPELLPAIEASLRAGSN